MILSKSQLDALKRATHENNSLLAFSWFLTLLQLVGYDPDPYAPDSILLDITLNEWFNRYGR